jgi:fructokinase
MEQSHRTHDDGPGGHVRIGVDVGGTKLEIIAIDRGGVEVLRHRVPTPRGNYEGTIEAIRSLVADAEARVGRSTVGVGMPGTISPATGLVKNANSTWLNGRAFGRDLSARLARELRLATTPTAWRCRRRPMGQRPGARRCSP